MLAHLRANFWLWLLTVVLCCLLYPAAIWAIGQGFFHDKAQGSLILDAKGNPVGSRLIGQPFTSDEWFWPRPSATTPVYNAAASGGSNYAANNILLRDRVARQLGPIVKYAAGAKKGQLVAADVESWFQKDKFDKKPGLVAQWAAKYPTIAQNWVKNDMTGDKYGPNGQYIVAWQKTHAKDVEQWKKDNPGAPDPKPEDLAAAFFTGFSKDHPGMFPSQVDVKGTTEKQVQPVKDGPDIQSGFFDMWLQDNPGVLADLEPVPGDAVTTSFSGLDPHITLKNALWQLDRVAGAWAKKANQSEAKVHKEIEELLRQKCWSPLDGLYGEPLVNVLEMNLALREQYQKP